MYDAIQSALTSLIQIIAIAGITGITAHAMWNHHQSWLATYCPPVKPFDPAEQVEAIALHQKPAEQVEAETATEAPEQSATESIADVWEEPITTSPARYWVRQSPTIKPALMLMPALEEKPAPRRGRKPTQPKPAKPKATKPAGKNTRKRTA